MPNEVAHKSRYGSPSRPQSRRTRKPNGTFLCYRGYRTRFVEDGGGKQRFRVDWLVFASWTRRTTVCSAFARWRQAHHHCWGSGHGPHLGRERRSMLCIRTLATGAPASLLVPGTGHISGESECEERAVTNTFLSEVFRPLPTLTVRLHVRPADHNPHCMTVLTRYRHIVHVLLSCA